MQKLLFSSLVTLAFLFSFVFFIVIVAMQELGVVDVGVAISLTISINIVLFLISPFISDLMHRWIYKVTFYSKDQVRELYPSLFEILEKVNVEHHIPFPKIGIIPDRNPTAFTYGTGQGNARIILTQGIFEFLSDEEMHAVIAHECGHIKNRDFLVMMIASTLIQILYELYVWLKNAKGKKAGNARLIALVAYVFYSLGTYLLLYLSRTREYLADQFASELTSPHALAEALIKIAYGIVKAEDSASSTRLLESTRHLGILDVKNAKHIGVLSYVTDKNPQVLSEVMVFDAVSPWAKIIELNSTHPLTGKRIAALGQLAQKLGQPFAYDIQEAQARLGLPNEKLYAGFIMSAFVYFAPVIAIIVSLIALPLPLVFTSLGLATLFQVLYKFPPGKAVKTTVLDLMRDPYASPVRGKPVDLSGQIIGRGVAGNVFSEDLMLQDTSGMIFLDFSSLFGFLGNLFFSMTKVKKLIGQDVHASGWMFRGMSSMVSLSNIITTSEGTITSHPIFWHMVGSLFLITLGIGLTFAFPVSLFGIFR